MTAPSPSPGSRGLGPMTTLALGLALALAAAGCDTARPGAGVFNGPPPESADDKAAMRTDVPIEDAPAGGEALGRLGDAQNDAGPAGRGGAGDTDEPRLEGADDSVRANPPAIESATPGGAAGADTPVDSINAGTPRSPR